MILPSAIRPVLDRRAIREASSSFFLRKRSRNDIPSPGANLGVKNSCGNATSDSAFCDILESRDDAFVSYPVVLSAKDLIFARQSQLERRKSQTLRCSIICRS